MAVTYFHVETCSSLGGSSTEVPRTGFKVEVPADGIIVALDDRYWSIKNTGKYDNSGTTADNAVDLFWRAIHDGDTVASTVPSLLYDSADAQARESLPIENGADEIIKCAKGRMVGIALKPLSGSLTVLFRPNEIVMRS